MHDNNNFEVIFHASTYITSTKYPEFLIEIRDGEGNASADLTCLYLNLIMFGNQTCFEVKIKIKRNNGKTYFDFKYK